MKFPLVFIGHGSPMMIIEENTWSDNWKKLAEKIPKPKAILMISAHWYPEETLIQTEDAPKMVYDMYGFPDALYEKVYPAKTSRPLIERVRELLPFEVKGSDRGYDHGCYAPLFHMYPKADIPLVQLSVNRNLTAEEMMDIGKALAPLREEEVLIFGSGNIVHNLRTLYPQEDMVYKPCYHFDQEMKKAILNFDYETLKNWKEIEGAELSAEYPDHLSPIFYVMGATTEGEPVEVVNEDYTRGSLSMTSYLIGKDEEHEH